MTVEKIVEAFASALQMDALELVAALKDGETWKEDASEVSDMVRNQVKAAKEDQRKRGLREASKAISNAMKKAGFTPDANASFEAQVDGFTAFLSEQQDGSEGNGLSPEKLSAEELQRLPAVKALIATAKQDAAKAIEAKDAEIKAIEAKHMQQRTSDVVRAALPGILETANVVLEAPGVNRQSRVEVVLRLIDMGKVRLNDEGKPIVVDDDGHPATDDMGKPIDFSKMVVSAATGVFGVHKADPNKGGAAPTGNAASTATSGSTYKFDSQQAFDSAYMREADPAVRLEMQKAWKEQQNAAQQ